jgi:hypothetical protein
MARPHNIARWTPERRKAHSKRIKALRALGASGPYRDLGDKLRAAHRDGRHRGFGERTRMSDDERREAQRQATARWRARRRGESYESGWPTVPAAVVRLHASLGVRNSNRVTTLPSEDPCWPLWAVGKAATA